MKILIAAFIFICFPFSASAQKSESYVFENGFCNTTLVLFADGSYNEESGCEAMSRFSFGKWTQKKDTLIFSVADNKSFSLINKIVSDSSNSKFLRVKILDKNGQNITSRISMGQYIKDKGSYMLNLDSTKNIKQDFKRDGGIIILRSLQKLLNQKVEIPTTSSNYYEITLNISNEWIFHSSSAWGGHGNFKLVKTKEGLLSLLPDKILYQAQK